MTEIVTDIQQLRAVCRPVVAGDDPAALSSLLFQILSEPREGRTLGLAAPQVGLQLRMFAMIYGSEPICIINPVLAKTRGSQVAEEMCLSLPGVKVRVERPQIVKVKGFNQYMKYVKYKLTALDARAACHEIDHLDGKLIIDYAEI